MKDSSICPPVILFCLTSVSSLPVFYPPLSRTLFQRKMEHRAASACGRKLCLCIHPAEGMQQLSKSCVTRSDYLLPSLFPFLYVFLPSTKILKSLLCGLSTGDSLWTKLDMVCPHANYWFNHRYDECFDRKVEGVVIGAEDNLFFEVKGNLHADLIFKIRQNKCWQGCGEKEHLCTTVSGSISW